MVYDTSDAGLLLIQKSFFTNANLPLAVLDGAKATTGTRGIWADFMVTKFEKSENLAEAQMVSGLAQAGYSSVGPSRSRSRRNRNAKVSMYRTIDNPPQRRPP
jgi:hypothetical protein